MLIVAHAEDNCIHLIIINYDNNNINNTFEEINTIEGILETVKSGLLLLQEERRV